MEKFEFLVKILEFIQKLRVSAQVRITHLKKQKKKCELTEETLSRLLFFEDWLEKELKEIVKNHPAYYWFKEVKGIGEINIGKVLGYIDIHKASKISKLWRYAGFSVNEDGRTERAKKGEKLHFNKSLKSMCWRLAKSLIRAKGKYYDFYIEQKKRLKEREEKEGKRIVPSKELPKKDGKHIENDEFFALGHIDMMAARKMTKLFLSHLWLVWREAEGLEITEPYVEAIKGHTNITKPEDFLEVS